MNHIFQNPAKVTATDVVKIIERENSGVRSTSTTRITIGYVLSGTKYIYYNDCCVPIKEGEVFVLDPGFHYEENNVGKSGSFESILFFLSAEMVQRSIFGLNLNYGLSFVSRHSCRNCSTYNFVSSEADAALRNFFLSIDLSLRNSGLLHNDVGQRIKLNELIYLILSGEDNCIKRRVLRSSDVLSNQFINIIYENLFNDVSVEELAELTNRSLTSFKKEFKRIFNMPPHRWIIEQRLNRARIMLTSTNRTVSEIGTECGFSNISHFIKLFKCRYNATPATFRHCNGTLLAKERRVMVGE